VVDVEHERGRMTHRRDPSRVEKSFPAMPLSHYADARPGQSPLGPTVQAPLGAMIAAHFRLGLASEAPRATAGSQALLGPSLSLSFQHHEMSFPKYPNRYTSGG